MIVADNVSYVEMPNLP